MGFSASSARSAMLRGLVVFAIIAFFGLKILIRGLRDDTADITGIPNGSRWWWIIAGILMQLPLIIFTVFAWRQGFFGR